MHNNGDKLAQKRAELLGMSFGAASNILRKSILFKLAGILDLLYCYRCGKIIELIKDFSIEHKNSWMSTANPKEAYFDLDNIAFSHGSCNSRHGMLELASRIEGVRFQKGHVPVTKIVTTVGFAWCGHCGEQPIEMFTRNKHRWNGLQDLCIKCRSAYRSPKIRG